MKIKYKQYSITPAQNAVGRYDLSVTILRNKKVDKTDVDSEPERYEAQSDMGYGMSLEGCLNQIVTNETNLGFGDAEATLKQYIDQYTKEKNELMVYIKNLTQLKIN